MRVAVRVRVGFRSDEALLDLHALKGGLDDHVGLGAARRLEGGRRREAPHERLHLVMSVSMRMRMSVRMSMSVRISMSVSVSVSVSVSMRMSMRMSMSASHLLGRPLALSGGGLVVGAHL